MRWVGNDEALNGYDKRNYFAAMVVRYQYSTLSDPDHRGLRRLVLGAYYWCAYVHNEPVDDIDYPTIDGAIAAAETAAEADVPPPPPPRRREERRWVANRPD